MLNFEPPPPPPPVNFDPVAQGRLEGPYFSTAGWDQDFKIGKAPGLHPVDMLARIAKFQGKTEPRFEPFSKNFRGRGSLGKIHKCIYEGGIEAFGNGKLEKQAKLVAARNMIEKLKQMNIGIVNETLAAGVEVDHQAVHKKPVTQQFKAFFKAGTLSSSFVSASSPSSSSSSTPVVVEPLAERRSKEELETYQQYIQGEQGGSSAVTGDARTQIKRTHSHLEEGSQADSEEGSSEAKLARTSGGELRPGWGAAVRTGEQAFCGPQVPPQERPEPPAPSPPPAPDPAPGQQFGYDWSQGAHRGGRGRGRGGGWAGVKPGDWPCSACGNANFAWRPACNKCGVPKQNSTVPVQYPGYGFQHRVFQ